METRTVIKSDRLFGDVNGVAWTEYTAPRYGHRLMLHLKSGAIKALAYSQLICPSWNNDGSIELEYVGHRVRITGRNLRQIYFAIANDMAAEIYEDHSHHDMMPRDPVERDRERQKPYVKEVRIDEI